jgi:heat shock protein HslJ
MKKYTFFVLVLLVTASACKTKKQSTETTPVEKQQTASMERDMPLSGTRWTPIELFGDSKLPAYTQQPYFVLVEKNGENAPRVEGHGGCNRFFGEFEYGDSTLKFSNIGSTKMYCQETSKTESVFLEALQKANKYSIKGNTLSLYDGKELQGRFTVLKTQ